MSNLFNEASLVLVPSGYKSGSIYSQVPTNGNGDLTFTRASDATRVNSDGLLESMATGVPRLDYSQGSCPALLLESQRTNLVLHSEQFNNWTQTHISITANTTTSPNGTLTADTLSIGVDASSQRHRLYQTRTIVIGTTYTGTYYLKANQHQWIQIVAVVGFSIGVWANFDLVNGTVGNTGGVDTTASIENVGNGWYRCRVSGVATGTSSTGFEVLVINNINNTRYPSYQSLVAEDVCYIWGAQLEVGSFASSYIPTTNATVTRLEDGQKVVGISSLIGQTEGTVFIDVYFQQLSQAGFRNFFNLEGTVANQVSGFSVNTTSNGNNISYAGSSYSLTTGRHKVVCTYSQTNNERRLYVDGVLRVTGTHDNFLATISQLSIGCGINTFTSFTTRRPLNSGSGINAFALYPILLSNDDCLTLSTL